MDSDTSYGAFISHSHADASFAEWLRDKLETYRVPEVVACQERAVGHVFLDRDELRADGSLGAALTAALKLSRALIVVCSPASAASRHVEAEIEVFRRLCPDRPVFPIILSGAPNTSIGSDTAPDECFPRPLRMSSGAKDPLAPDYRQGKDGRHRATIKLIAGLLNLALGALLRRDAERHALKLAAMAGDQIEAAAAEYGIAVALQAHALLTADADRAVSEQIDAAVYRSLTSSLARHRLTGHAGGVRHAAFNADGSEIVTTDAEGTLRLWNIAADATARHIDSLPGRAVRAEFGSAGELLVLVPGEPLLMLTRSHPDAAIETSSSLDENTTGAQDMALSPDRRQVACCGDDGVIRVWHVGSGRQVLRLAPRPPARLLQFCADNATLLAVLADESVAVWSLPTGRPRGRTKSHNRMVIALAMAPDASGFATADADGSIYWWQLSEPPGGAGWQDRLLACLWRWKSWSRRADLVRSFTGHVGAVLGLGTTEDAHIVSTADDQSLRWWSVGDGRLLSVANAPRPSPDSQPTAAELFARMSPDAMPMRTDEGRRKERSTLQTLLVLHPRHWQLAAAHGSLVQWGPQFPLHVDNDLPLPVLHAHEQPITCLIYSDDGHHLLTGSDDGTAGLWFARFGADLVRECRLEVPIKRLVFSGNRVVAISERTVWVIDPCSARATVQLHATGAADFRHAALSPSGQQMATTDSAACVVLWDGRTGVASQLLYQAPKRYALSVFLIFAMHNPIDGERNRQVLRDAYPDLAAWFESTREQGSTLSPTIPMSLIDAIGHENLPESIFVKRDVDFEQLAFSHDGEHLIAVDEDRRIRAWCTATGAPCDASSTLAWPGMALLDARNALIPRSGSGEEVMSPDARMLAMLQPEGRDDPAGGRSTCVEVWDNLVGQRLASVSMDEPASFIGLSAAAQRLVLGRASGGARIVDTSSGAVVADIPAIYNACGFSNQHRLSAAGQRLLVTNPRTRTVRLYSTISGKELAALVHPWEVAEACLSADETCLATTSANGQTVWLWRDLPGSAGLQARARSCVPIPLPFALQQACAPD